MGLHYAGIKRGNAGRETRPVSCLTLRTNGVGVSRFAKSLNVVNRDTKQRSGARVGGSRAGGNHPSKVTPEQPATTNNSTQHGLDNIAGVNTINRKQPPPGGR